MSKKNKKTITFIKDNIYDIVLTNNRRFITQCVKTHDNKLLSRSKLTYEITESKFIPLVRGDYDQDVIFTFDAISIFSSAKPSLIRISPFYSISQKLDDDLDDILLNLEKLNNKIL